jgi:hypothetical protein
MTKRGRSTLGDVNVILACLIALACGGHWADNEDLRQLRAIADSACSCPSSGIRWALRNISDNAYTYELRRTETDLASGGVTTRETAITVGGKSWLRLECTIEPLPSAPPPPPPCSKKVEYAFVTRNSASETANSGVIRIAEADSAFAACKDECQDSQGDCGRLPSLSRSAIALRELYDAARESSTRRLDLADAMALFGVKADPCLRERYSAIRDTAIAGSSGVVLSNTGASGSNCVLPLFDTLPIELRIPIDFMVFDRERRLSITAARPLLFLGSVPSIVDESSIPVVVSRVLAAGLASGPLPNRLILVLPTTTGCLAVPYE